MYKCDPFKNKPKDAKLISEELKKSRNFQNLTKIGNNTHSENFKCNADKVNNQSLNFINNSFQNKTLNINKKLNHKSFNHGFFNVRSKSGFYF